MVRGLINRERYMLIKIWKFEIEIARRHLVSPLLVPAYLASDQDQAFRYSVSVD